MRFIETRLAADEGYELTFKNDLGSINSNGIYEYPSLFISCFPAKSINTIKKAKEIFTEIKFDDKQAYLDECYVKFKEQHPKFFPENTEETTEEEE